MSKGKMHKAAFIILASCILENASCSHEIKPLKATYNVSYDESYIGDTKETTGKIAGQVINMLTNKGVKFCKIEIQGTNKGTVTDLDGDYFIIQIPPGTYNVQAGREGYPAVMAENVRIEISKTTTVNFQLVKDPSYEEPKIKIDSPP